MRGRVVERAGRLRQRSIPPELIHAVVCAVCIRRVRRVCRVLIDILVVGRDGVVGREQHRMLEHVAWSSRQLGSRLSTASLQHEKTRPTIEMVPFYVCVVVKMPACTTAEDSGWPLGSRRQHRCDRVVMQSASRRRLTSRTISCLGPRRGGRRRRGWRAAGGGCANAGCRCMGVGAQLTWLHDHAVSTFRSSAVRRAMSLASRCSPHASGRRRLLRRV